MAGGDVAESKSHGKGKKKKKQGRRLGVRIDMTPLVDVAFLLLTFFMYTTSMSRPQTMEINLPPDKNVKVEIAESNLMTLRINDKGMIYWNIALDAPKIIDAKDLRAFLVEKQTAIPKLTVLLKIDRLGKYKMMVDLIDELNNAGVQRFSLAPLGDPDKALMAKVQG
jgi:biopolymer transport protein ExbD